MPYRISWYVPRKIVLVYVYGNITVGDLKQIKSDTITFESDGDAPVYVVIDILQVDQFPQNVQDVAKVVMQGKDPSRTTKVLITNNRIMRFLSETIFQVLQIELRVTETMSDAIELLRRLDPTIAEAEQEAAAQNSASD